MYIYLCGNLLFLPKLPILETLQALFPHTKITEETEVLVKDVEYFTQISIVIATSDKK